jgi:hypothetical protein
VPTYVKSRFPRPAAGLPQRHHLMNFMAIKKVVFRVAAKLLSLLRACSRI